MEGHKESQRSTRNFSIYNAALPGLNLAILPLSEKEPH